MHKLTDCKRTDLVHAGVVFGLRLQGLTCEDSGYCQCFIKQKIKRHPITVSTWGHLYLYIQLLYT